MVIDVPASFVPKAAVLLSLSVPALTVVAPVHIFVPEYKVPAPAFTVPDPLMIPEIVN